MVPKKQVQIPLTSLVDIKLCSNYFDKSDFLIISLSWESWLQSDSLDSLSDTQAANESEGHIFFFIVYVMTKEVIHEPV